VKAIIAYHSIDESGSVISLAPGRFREQVRWLASGAVRVLPVADLVAADDGRPAIALTFDDGFANFADVWPLLRDTGLPVTLFVPSGFVGASNRWEALPGAAMPVLDLLDWHTLGRLAEEGVTLGAHSRTHRDLRALSDEMLEEEVAGSLADIRRETGARVDAFAYPYGYHDERVVASVGAVCTWACTTALRPVRTGDPVHALPRLDSYYLRGPARLTAFGSRGFRWYLAGRNGLRRLRAG